MSIARRLLEALETNESKKSLDAVLKQFEKAGFTKVGPEEDFIVLKSPNGTRVTVTQEGFEGQSQDPMGKPSSKGTYHSVYVNDKHYGNVNPSQAVDVARRLSKV